MKICLKNRSLWLTVLKSSCKEMFLKYSLFSLSEADVSALPVKRSLAERLGKKVEVPGNADKAPKRGTATKQASGCDSRVLYLGSLFVLFLRCFFLHVGWGLNHRDSKLPFLPCFRMWTQSWRLCSLPNLVFFCFAVQVPKSVKERLGLPFQKTSTAKGKNWLLNILSPSSFLWT